jgi:hypothetical protein
MRDLIRAIWPTLTWFDLAEFLFALLVLFILPGVALLDAGDTGRAVVHFVLAVTFHD